LFLVHIELEILIIGMLSHEIQKEGPIPSNEQVIMDHPTIHVKFIEKSAWHNSTRQSETIPIKMNAFTSYWQVDEK